jgi:integrase
MKKGIAHIVPLSPLASEIIEEQRRRRIGPRIFPNISYPRFARAPHSLGLDAKTPHGWRSVFASWASDSGRYPKDLIEHALAHKLDRTASAYIRVTNAQQRASMMAAYARWLTGAEAEIVTTLASRRARRK